MDTNQALLKLYASKWDDLCKILDDNQLTGYEYSPLLLHIDDPEDFNSADIKVMIFGQDMSEGDWYSYSRQTQSLEECMKAIRTFDNKIGSVDLNGKRGTKTMGRGMNRLIDTFNAVYPDKKIRYVWNNVAKLGRNVKSNQHKDLLTWIEKEYFDVVKDEINIVCPQVLVFLTGPSVFWEVRLQQDLGIGWTDYLPVPGWNGNTRQLARLNLDANVFPTVKYAFRTYHPCARECKIYVKHAELYRHIVRNTDF